MGDAINHQLLIGVRYCRSRQPLAAESRPDGVTRLGSPHPLAAEFRPDGVSGCVRINASSASNASIWHMLSEWPVCFRRPVASLWPIVSGERRRPCPLLGLWNRTGACIGHSPANAGGGSATALVPLKHVASGFVRRRRSFFLLLGLWDFC
jgi:hypothetical protein